MQVALDGYTSANLFLARAYYTGDTLPANDIAGTVRAGAISRPYAGPQVAPNKAGTKSRYFIDDWYYRIHVIPGALDMGNLVSSQSRDVLLWNAYLAPSMLSAFASEGLNGITVTPPVGLAPPTQLKALGLYEYQVEVSVAGPPTISASVTWTIEGVEYRVPITGRRVIAFAFAPNWNRQVEETVEFRATVLTNHDGSEQRASNRARGRRTFDYTTLVKGTEAQRFDSLMFGWQGRMFALPLWPEESALSEAVPAGSTVLQVPTTDRSFVAGGLLMVYRDSALTEVREIEDVQGNTITLTSGLSLAWPAGTAVLPALVGTLTPAMSGSRLTDNLTEVPVRFSAEPSATSANASGAAAATYLGVELYLRRPNWISGLSFEWASDAVLLDTGTGRTAITGRSGVSQLTKGHNWTLKGLGDVSAFRGWLERRGGRAVPVYIPSGFDDFTLVEAAVSSDTGIECRQNAYETVVDGHPARRDVLILFRDGTHLARRVFSAETTTEGHTRLVFTESLGRDFTPADVKRISFLGLYRLASDATTLAWQTRGVATVDASLVNTAT